MAKGGGHNKGQTMPYSSVRAFDGGKPMRQGHWGFGAARLAVRDSLVAANRRDLVLEASIVDRSTGEVVWQPAKCAVCRSAWATETGPERAGDEWSRCDECADVAVDEQPVANREFFTGKLYCLRCPVPGSAAPLSVASSDLPEGGICAGCGTDVLITEQPASFAEAVAERAVELPAVDPANGRIRLIPPSDGDALICGRTGRGKTSLASVAAVAEHVARTAVEQVNKAAGFESAVAPFLLPNELPDADPSALLAALDRLNIERAVWSDGTVAAVANGMLWTMRAEPHAVTGEPCGVWSVASPEAVRGHFVAEGAARFVRDRRTP